jgi:hypothetical protein
MEDIIQDKLDEIVNNVPSNQFGELNQEPHEVFYS